MKFTGSNTENVDDGSGGTYVQGTFELDIPKATGRYEKFVGGHNTMVDDLHLLASGDADEFCVCLFPVHKRQAIVRISTSRTPADVIAPLVYR